MVVRAWVWSFVILVVAGAMGTVALISIWDEAGITDDYVQFGSLGLYGVLVFWRVWRLGAVLTPERVTVRGFFVDHHYRWDQVLGFEVLQSANSVGETCVPGLRLVAGVVPCDKEGDKDGDGDGDVFNWLSGYSFRGSNRRVRRQVERMNAYRAALDRTRDR